MELFKVTTCDTTTAPQKIQEYPTTKIGNTRWLNANVQDLINPPLIPVIRSASEKVVECNIIKIKMIRDPELDTSKTYDIKVPTFKNGEPEEFLQMMK